jgi:hypothetical protein
MKGTQREEFWRFLRDYFTYGFLNNIVGPKKTSKREESQRANTDVGKQEASLCKNDKNGGPFRNSRTEIERRPENNNNHSSKEQ